MAFSVVGFIGACKYNEMLTKIYFFFTLFQLVLTIVGIIVTALTTADFAADGCIGTSDEALCEVAYYIGAALCAFLSPCFVTVIHSAPHYEPFCTHGQLVS